MIRADIPLEFPDVRPPDFDAPVVYLPVRHHSPACAFHVGRVIRALGPASVLVEGPRDATPLISYLADSRTRPPVALYTTFVRRRTGAPPEHHGAYYPLVDYSPELLAVRAGTDVGAEVRFIDLTFPEMIVAQEQAGRREDDSAEVSPMRSLQDELHFRRSRLLRAASRQVGARDPDDLWDCLFEHDFRNQDAEVFFHRVLTWCALARHDHTPEMLASEAHDVREQAMRAEIDEAAVRANGRKVVVVTGGFHSVALAETKAHRPKAIELADPDDAGITLIRYGFEQLDRLNGYASGMPSPEFYQRLWEERDPAGLLAEIGRELRERLAAPSTAEVSVALEQVHRLAVFRGHATPTREDLLDGIRSVFVKGVIDIEGVAVLAVTRKCLTGRRTGEIPPEAGRPPLVLDFERTARAEHVSLEVEHDHDMVLDLYRSAAHRMRSRFFHRLRLLEVPFAKWVRGPDYVAGQNLDRVTEAWRYRWQPGTEARLIEQSKFGATIEEAAAAVLLERFADAERSVHSSEAAARLVLEAYRCGLHEQAPALLGRTAPLMAVEPSFSSVVGACLDLDLLRLSREPLEAQHEEGIEELVVRGWERAAFLVPQLGTTSEADETAVLDGLCTWSALAASLPEREIGANQRGESLRALAGSQGGNPVLLGAALGLLYDDGELEGPELGRHLAGHLRGATTEATQGARFLRGVLRAARSTCWQEPSVIDAVHESLGLLDEDSFVQALPHLRLAFSDLTPLESDRVAAAAAARCGAKRFVRFVTPDATQADVLLGMKVDRLVTETLARDGWTPDD